MALLAELDVFYPDHRRDGGLVAGVDGSVVLVDCACGARLTRRAGEDCAE